MMPKYHDESLKQPLKKCNILPGNHRSCKFSPGRGKHPRLHIGCILTLGPKYSLCNIACGHMHIIIPIGGIARFAVRHDV